MRNPLRWEIGRRGLTRVEWVAVLGALAILGFLGMDRMPNRDDFLRSKVSGTRSRMRAIAVALEAYQADYHAYPPMRPMDWKKITPGKTIRPDMNGITIWPASLRGGTVEISDPFEIGAPPAYFSKGTAWIAYSPGPDGVYDLRTEFLEKADITDGSAAIAPFRYDPTNGTKSSGDIVRFMEPELTRRPTATLNPTGR